MKKLHEKKISEIQRMGHIKESGSFHRKERKGRRRHDALKSRHRKGIFIRGKIQELKRLLGEEK